MKPSFKTALILSAIGVPALFGIGHACATDQRSVTAAPAARFAPYVGVWGPTVAACRGGGRDVFRITAKGEEGQEWQCEIKHASEGAGGWSMRLACASEGNDYNERARWRIDEAGNLHQTIGGKAKAYVRCRDGDFHATDSD
jgi:hypothetical protein